MLRIFFKCKIRADSDYLKGSLTDPIRPIQGCTGADEIYHPPALNLDQCRHLGVIGCQGSNRTKLHLARHQSAVAGYISAQQRNQAVFITTIVH